jgi:hypothetical protein
MSNKVNAAIIVLILILVGVLIISGIVLRNSFFVLGGCGLLLASFVMFSSIVEQNE